MSTVSEVLDDYGQIDFLSISSFLPQSHLLLTAIYEQAKQKGEAIAGKHMKRGLWEEFLGLYVHLFVSSVTSY